MPSSVPATSEPSRPMRAITFYEYGSPKQMASAIFLGPVHSRRGGKRLGYLAMKSNLEDLELLRDRLADGSVRSVIDRTYPLEKLPEALAYLEEGHARGKVVIHVS